MEFPLQSLNKQRAAKPLPLLLPLGSFVIVTNEAKLLYEEMILLLPLGSFPNIFINCGWDFYTFVHLLLPLGSFIVITLTSPILLPPPPTFYSL